jgi:hypothetical protein
MNALTLITMGSRTFLAKFAKRDNAEGTAPDWSDPTVVTLDVVLRERDVKVFGRQHYAGEIIRISVYGLNWCDYGPEDFGADNVFETEEWRMQLLEDRSDA